MTDQGEDVSVRVLEPRGLDAVAHMYIAGPGKARKVIVLEADAFAPQLLHDRFQIAFDLPGRGGGLVGPGVL